MNSAPGPEAAPWRVLITNTQLATYTGSELYVRDVALGLLERGHLPIVYSPRLGPLAQALRAATVPVVDDLNAVGVAPSLIHGQHHLETLTALQHFPGVPAVFFSHGWLPWQEAPPRHPRLHHYVAVNEVVADRLLYEHGLPAEQVTTILNFVDLSRFRPRPPLPDRPRRALIFSNHASAQTFVEPVLQACARHGVALDVVGVANGNPTTQPEALLGQYDLVFARGRAALESMAVGAAVIACDFQGMGGLVTAAELDWFYRNNVGIRVLRRPITVEALAHEIGRYDAADAERVSAAIRSQASLDVAMDRILATYAATLSAAAQATPATPETESRAVADYLRWLSGLVQADLERGYALAGQLDVANAERGRLQHALEAETMGRSQALSEREALQQQLAVVTAEKRTLDDRLAQLSAEQLQSQARQAELHTWHGQLQAEVERLQAELAAIMGTLTWRLHQRVTRSANVRRLYSRLTAPIKHYRARRTGQQAVTAARDDQPAGGAQAGPPAAKDAPDRPPRLLALLRFHNEMRWLPDYFLNIAPHVDGIIALDDGSTDGSTELARRQPAVLQLIVKPPREPHVWDEAEDRRRLLEAASGHRPDWLMVVDADERLEQDFRSRANAAIRQAELMGTPVLGLQVRELWDYPDRVRVDGIWGQKCFPRLFKARSDFEIDERPLHGLWAPLNSLAASGFTAADLNVYHLRMQRPADRRARQARYQALDPDRQWQPLGYEYMTVTDGLVLEALPPGRGYEPMPRA